MKEKILVIGQGRGQISKIVEQFTLNGENFIIIDSKNDLKYIKKRIKSIIENTVNYDID